MSSPSRCGATQHRRIIIAIGILALSAHPAAAQTKYIGVNGGAWNGLGNWSLGTPDANSPTTFDAWIDNGNTPNLTIPTASVRRLRVGVLSSGGLEIDNGVLNVTQDFHVNEGAPNTSIVAVKNGGDLISPSTVVGFSGAGDAFFTITGAGSTVSGGQFIVGYFAAGTLSLSNGGSLNTSGAPLYIAAQGGAGLVRIGAGLSAGTLTASEVQFGSGPGTLQFDHTGAHTFSTPIDGPGNVVKTGAGETTLTGTNSYTGATTIAGGKLIVGADANLGVGTNSGDQLLIAGGTLRATNTFTLSATRRIGIINAGGGIEVDASRTLTYPGNLALSSGGPPATFTKSGGGILEVTGSLRVSEENLSKIIVNQGELRSGPLGLGDNSTKGAIEVVNGAVLRTGAAVLGDSSGIGSSGGEGHATISGVGSSWLAAAITLAEPRSEGTLTIADGGAVSINGGASPLTLVTAGVGSEGVLNIGNGGAPGSLFASAIVTNASTVLGTVNFNHTGSLNFSVPIQNGARVNKLGSGTTILLGTHSYNKPTTVSAGTLVVSGSLTNSAPTVNGGSLIVNGSVPNPIAVSSNGTLGGMGTVGAVNVASGGSLSPGASAGTLTTGSLSLAPGSFSRFELATPGVQGGANDLGMVNGNLDFGGTLVVTELPGFGAGQYTLFKYTAIATNQGLAFEPAFLAAHPGSTIVNDVANQRVVANITGSTFLPGDFNENGVVDGADLTAWRNGFGGPAPNPHTEGDADGDNDVDGADFLTWQRQVGTLPATIAAAAIPEPTSLALIAGACSIIATCRRSILSTGPKS